MRKILGPVLIATFALLLSLVAPFVSSIARAAPAVPTAAVKSPALAKQLAPTAGNGKLSVYPAQDGAEVDERASAMYGHYGAWNQSTPLDFSTQPASVPRVYVPGKLYNVQVLKGLGYGQLIVQMSYYSTALGVSCTYCHAAANFAYDTPTKKIARTMQIMSAGVQKSWIDPVKHDYPNYSVTGAVGCETCHRGKPQMAVQWNIVPVQYLDYKYKSTKQVGYVVNSMYSVARSLGVDCLHCHNTADFISLQYYPTNKIAHRMWAMVDEINHKYLPPNVEAVTCYTCHHGAKWPSALVSAGLDQKPVQAIAAHPEYHDNPAAHLSGGEAKE